jgi:uncharacterized protein YyaL (SSP411 family)
MSPNRLANALSPYLLQHQDNPVDWHMWGEEAFAKAKAEDKPVLLSVGYSACHWCHVMAHESFEDEATAALMNRYFVNIKVDREERPDIDAIYMSAVQAMTGSGGWPMTVVMTPDGQPFFGGTYFPKTERYGQPSFTRVLLSLHDAWENRRAEVLASAQRMTQYLGALNQFSAADAAPLAPALLNEALKQLAAQFDAEYGGFGDAPKFPPHSALRFLLRQSDPQALSMAEQTLSYMAKGGIYDQLGGGFARYSVDRYWLVPHFEKMLYDNAQLVQRYAEAYQRTRKPLYRRIVTETLAWVEREMLSPEGGFYSALDADSEGEEGKFYLWGAREFDQLLGEDAALLRAHYGVREAGNFEGRNILVLAQDGPELAARFGYAEAELQRRLERGRAKLLAARQQRVRPGLDDKILTSWNALMLAAFADAGRILIDRHYLDVAERNAAFLLRTVVKGNRLMHVYKDGSAQVDGLLEDYAYLAQALIALYRATLKRDYLRLAFELIESILQHFQDARGGFYSTPDDGERLIVRPKNYIDSPNPSENGVVAELLITRARYTGDVALESLAKETIVPLREALTKHPNGFGTLLCALEFLLRPPSEIALVGDRRLAEPFLQALADYPLPYTVIAQVSEADDPLVAMLPFLQGRPPKADTLTAYLCQGGACQLPATTAEAFRAQLEAWIR